jgi:hypothetical protein
VFVVPDMAADAPQHEARPVASRPVEVIARGPAMAAVSGIADGAWVVSAGQHLLARDRATRARVRQTTWERVLQLQGLQREDLLAQFLEKQQTIARARGAEPPPSSEYLGAGNADSQ